MSRVKKTFKTKVEMNKFISENTLINPVISEAGLSIIHGTNEVVEDTAGCVGCNAGMKKEEPVPFDVTKLASKGAVINAIKEKAVGIYPQEKLDEFADMNRTQLNEFYLNDGNFPTAAE